MCGNSSVIPWISRSTAAVTTQQSRSKVSAVQAVIEIVEDYTGGTYRAVYTVKFAEAVFVLHCFQKKSKSGIATPKEDINTIRTRLKVAETLAEELRHGKAHN